MTKAVDRRRTMGARGVALTALLVLAGCGSSDSDAKGPGTTVVATDNTAAATDSTASSVGGPATTAEPQTTIAAEPAEKHPATACELLTVAEISEAVGAQVRSPEAWEDGNCLWYLGDADSPRVVLGMAPLEDLKASVEAAGGTLEPVEGRKGRLISTFPKDPVRFPEGKVSEKVGAGDQVLSADLLFWADEAAVAGLKAKLLDAMAAKYV